MDSEMAYIDKKQILLCFNYVSVLLNTVSIILLNIYMPMDCNNCTYLRTMISLQYWSNISYLFADLHLLFVTHMKLNFHYLYTMKFFIIRRICLVICFLTTIGYLICSFLEQDYISKYSIIFIVGYIMCISHVIMFMLYIIINKRKYNIGDDNFSVGLLRHSPLRHRRPHLYNGRDTASI